MASNLLQKNTLTRSLTAPYLSSLRFESCLGSGAFGLVLKATNLANGSQTAVKFIFPPATQDGTEQKKILRECNIKALDPHQNIVKVIDTIEGSFTLSQLNGMLPEALFKNEADKSFRDLYFGRLTRVQELEGVLIQMELCGETLRQWLREKHDKLDSALHKKQYAIVKNLIAGLAHLHKNKILHRDLKPENVMFSKTGFVLPVKIGDFGLSRHLHSEQSRTNPLTSRTGTLDYRASECLDNDYSFPADLYSLGLMIWEVAQLIKSNDRSKMFDKLVNDKEVSLIELHPQIKGLRELIIALTKKSASDRFQQLEQVQKVFAQKELCDLKEGHHLTARNGEELRKLLKGATPGSKIFLIEAEYDGNFVVEGESITIVGKGEKTVFTNSGSNSFVVKGMGHRILNLKISKSGEHAGFNCLRVEGDMNSFSDLILIGGAYSVKIEGNDNKLDKIQVSVAIKGIHITGSRNTIDDICLTGDTTRYTIKFGPNAFHGWLTNSAHMSDLAAIAGFLKFYKLLESVYYTFQILRK
ncbi:interferon-induced, double-stranded RNA-activated protein kinase isoform X1 [Folsomia candida]|uniref:non-specific serine/threonine protein kinase n=1 Tax=Folsomia candida TaxID=158441 RepID=A0A226DWH2_FOLCA|nr:interferon-induced, double-stranded RNA-activated protein kinase isoform X1 [Folsomia candida]OXA49835.1 Cyclin-dependent kinase 9-B [Folsomia candida]